MRDAQEAADTHVRVVVVLQEFGDAGWGLENDEGRAGLDINDDDSGGQRLRDIGDAMRERFALLL